VKDFKSYLSCNIESLLKISEESVKTFTTQLKNTIANDGILWVAGNGGSASTASHLCCDLSKGVSLKNGVPVRAFAFMDQLATFTAWANDFSFDSALAEMCTQYLRKQDLFIAISASGNSSNLVNAIKQAKKLKVPTVSLTGFNGGVISSLTDHNVNVPSDDMQVIENAHLIICHWLFKDL
jgi:D-sedoheptulose 7-phosphate isomerase